MEEKLLSSSYINQAKTLLFAGSGEVFYSPTYRRLLDSNLKRDSIYILSNGILFNKNNYNWLKEKFSIIDVRISVDAATKETYTKLRGGNFDTLMKNLEMIADLHRRGKVRELILNFVVQRDNFQEMPSFVKLGKSLGVDFVEFQHLCNFGNLTEEEFVNRSLIINNEYLNLELCSVLQNPIFKDPIVDLRGFNRYIEMSKIYYNKKDLN